MGYQVGINGVITIATKVVFQYSKLDANKIQHPSALLGWLQERWSNRGHPRPYVPKHCFYKINRGDYKAFGEAFYRCSYLAKARGKGYGSLGINNYLGSRVGFKKELMV